MRNQRTASATVSEHWTVTGEGLVLAGSPGEIDHVAEILGLRDEDVVYVTPWRATIALWGSVLDIYRAWQSLPVATR